MGSASTRGVPGILRLLMSAMALTSLPQRGQLTTDSQGNPRVRWVSSLRAVQARRTDTDCETGANANGGGHQRFRPSTPVAGVERASGAPVRGRDFHSTFIALETTTPARMGQLMEVDLSLRRAHRRGEGPAEALERVAPVNGQPCYVTVLELRRATTQEHADVDSFIRSIPEANSAGVELSARRSIRAAPLFGVIRYCT